MGRFVRRIRRAQRSTSTADWSVDRAKSQCERHTNASTSCAQVEHIQSTCFTLTKPCESPFDEQLCAWTRDKRARFDFKVTTEKRPPTHEKLHGLMARRAADKFAQSRKFTRIEFAIRFHVEAQSFYIEHGAQENLCNHPRRIDAPFLQKRRHPSQKRSNCPRSALSSSSGSRW
jgi:hypothetical protein